MANFTAVLDACVLYPFSLRDILMNLAETDCFRARWTSDITDEWTRHVIADNDRVTRPMLDRTIQCMTDAVPDCLITNYQFMVDSIQYTDEKDRHVLAAAIVGYADVIVTANLKDFDADAILANHDIEIQHPDTFISHIIDLNPVMACGAFRRWRKSLKNPPFSPDELLELILRQGLPVTHSKFKERIDLI